MARPRTVYECEACGAQAPKWSGQCADCGAWNTLSESRMEPTSGPSRGARGGGQYAGATGVVNLGEVQGREEARIGTGIGEMDRVLGGGLVTGSAVLIGGDPGIGKSTLLLQVCARLAGDRKVLYVTGEESLEQVRLRGERLQVTAQELRLAAETCIERIIATAEAERPGVLVVDSIQTIFSEALQSAPGAVGQLREATAQLVRFAKQTGTAVFLVGHVTKQGTIAGPRVLEHMVDTVLYFENDAGSRYRVVRAVKNRFGAVNELGVFAMDEQGLREVKNPSAIFLSGHQKDVPGSVIMVAREGSRPLLVEVQALVDESHMHNPRRVALGLDPNRMAMLLAVAHRHGGIAMADQDVFVNVVGGLRVEETAADLALLMAALSSFRDRPVPSDLVCFGEVGLSGEVRPVYNGEERIHEAAKHGFRRAVVPRANQPRRVPEGLEVIPVNRVAEAFDVGQ